MKIINAKTFEKYFGLIESEELVPCELIAADGKIVEFGSQVSQVSDDDEVIDAKGALLLPGFIDPQVHFREPGQEYKEDIESGSRAAARGGFTTVICMPNTSPATDSPEVINHIYKRSSEVDLCRVLPTACVTKGLSGEVLVDYSALKKAGAIAFTDDGKGIQSDDLMFKAMTEIAKLKMPLLDHSEDESLSLGGSIHKGAISKKYQLKGIDSRSESEHVRRGCDYALKTGCHFHVLHISTKESIEHVREAKRKGAPVTAEVSPHHLLLCDEDIKERSPGELDPNFKMNPPLRGKDDKLACQKAFTDGTIDMVATDHAPHSMEEKSAPIEDAPFGIVGVETCFPLLYTHFVKTGKMTLFKLVDMMTVQPARLFHLDAGHLRIGDCADLTLIDLNDNKSINVDDFLSKGKNSPFIGERVFGIPQITIYKGKVTFRKEKNV